MHFIRLTPLAVVLIAFSIIGCSSNTRNQKSISFTRVYVETPQSLDLSNVNQFNSTVVETAEGELRSRGYTVTNSKTDAQATLRSTWHVSTNNGMRKDDVAISLSMSLFTNQGKKVFSSDSGSPVPANYWNVAKTATTVDNILSQLPLAERTTK